MLAKTNKLLLIFLLAATAGITQQQANMEYELSMTDSNVLHVTLQYSPYEDDSTVFTYGEPLFGGQTDILKGLSSIKIALPGSIRIDTANRIFTVYYPQRQTVSIDYYISDTHAASQGVRGELFRPIVQKDYFYSHGINLFLNPVFRKKDTKATVSIRWVQPPAFPVFYGFDPENKGKITFYGRLEDVLYSLITGASNQHVYQLGIQHSKSYIVLRESDTDPFKKSLVENYFKHYYKGIREFWNDSDSGNFSLILHPFLKVNHNISGVAFSNGFIGKYKADTVFNSEQVFTISHEIGHHWLGHILSMDTKHQWFDEGFNDYTTGYNLVVTHLYTSHKFLDEMNTVFQKHYSSAIKNCPNDSVFLNYWKMGDYNKLPYRRGSIFAFYLDQQIRNASHNKKTIHALLLALLQVRKNNGEGYIISTDDFIKAASLFLAKDSVKTAIEKYILAGNPIQFTKDMLVPGLSIHYTIGQIPVLSITDDKKFQAFFIDQPALSKHAEK
jgi:predicted metalloprotease with PDZ domain